MATSPHSSESWSAGTKRTNTLCRELTLCRGRVLCRRLTLCRGRMLCSISSSRGLKLCSFLLFLLSFLINHERIYMKAYIYIYIYASNLIYANVRISDDVHTTLKADLCNRGFASDAVAVEKEGLPMFGHY